MTHTDPAALARRFPDDFVFGVATAAYQIEGATRADGRGPSIWDAFSNMPGRVFREHNGDVACDHYHRWESDLDLIKELGVDAYRFSIAWPRILPLGRGAVNAAGLDFYDRLIDGLVARGIKVFPTLYHWDLPLALAGYGGWTDRDTAQAFADYAAIVVRRLGDRMDALSTFNEPWCSTYLGHWTGKHAPGERSIDAALAAVHVTNLAHGLGVQAARAERADLPMGVVLNAQSTYAASDSEADRGAAERYHQFHNGVFFGPMFAGRYDEAFEAALGDKLRMRGGDLATIHQPLDWWGFNYYYPATVRHAETPDANTVEDAAFAFLKSAPVESTTTGVRTDIGWEIKAEGLSHLLKTVYARYDLPPVYITENGAAYNMGPDANGVIDDQPRLAYLDAHLSEAAGAIADGIPLKGYFAWSLMDNYEWAEGYKMRFGLVHVDYDTQVRTTKASGAWYRDLAVAHAGG
ncbi:MAG: GH1 family beta-glucosidase [Pseudomonadota bacterium]